MRRVAIAGVLLLGLAGCAEDVAPRPEVQAAARDGHDRERERARTPVRPRHVDPRRGGLDVVLGEWAVTPEADAIRPGQVTFVVHNRGTMGHGFEMELEGESSGPGSGELFKAESELVQPGESTRVTVTLLPGLYEIECLVDGHDDMGMEGVLEVRADAPLVEVRAPREPGRVAIADFAFEPATTKVPRGTEVVWRNDDPADHTVTAAGGDFGSESLAPGDTFSHEFAEHGVYEYRCAIHPEMEGKVMVE